MSEVFIERAAPLTKDGIKAVCGTDEEYDKYVEALISDGDADHELNAEDKK